MSPACRPAVNEVVLLIVLLSGLCSCLRIYKFISEPKTWGEAQQHCREKFSDLATVGNLQDVDQLIAAAGGVYGGKAWIGLYDKSSSWRWTMQDDGTSELFLHWTPGEPADRRDGWKLCVIVKDGLLNDIPCVTKGPFLCSDNSNASAPGYVIKVQWFHAWDGAQNYCRTFHSDLASWRDAAGWHQALQAIPAGIIPYVGLYRNTWSSWSDGSQHGFKNFLPGRPSGLTGDCAASFIGGADAGKWTEDFCDHKLPFVCNYEEKHQLRIKLRVLKSSADLNDPAVTEAIIRLLEEKMKEKGIPAGFKLRFIKKPDDTVFQEEKDEL